MPTAPATMRSVFTIALPYRFKVRGKAFNPAVKNGHHQNRHAEHAGGKYRSDIGEGCRNCQTRELISGDYRDKQADDGQPSRTDFIEQSSRNGGHDPHNNAARKKA